VTGPANLPNVQPSARVSDLTVTWWTLRTVLDRQEIGSPEWVALITVCRLIENEALRTT
jgi:hypothetical protein